MFYLSDETLDRYIQEDIPYFDLTTWVSVSYTHLDVYKRQETEIFRSWL